MTRLPQVTPQTSSTNFSQTHSWAVQSWGNQKYGSYYSWTRFCWLLESKIQFLQRSIARNFRNPRPSINKSRAPNFFIQHDKVEDYKLCHYLETCGRALEQFLQRQMSSNESIIFLLSMLLDRLVRGRTLLGERY